MAEHTTVKLAKALSEIPGVPKEMIQKAIDGYYHDYLSPLTFPEIQLVKDLHELARLPATPKDSRVKLHRMTHEVANGEYDASEEESAEWAASPEGQETFRQFLTDAMFTRIARNANRERTRTNEQGKDNG